MRGLAGGLWGHRDFVHLWAAASVSTFGSLVTRAALPFLAVLTLGATPAQMAVLRAADLVPAVVVGLAAGVWVDRLRRRPILIWTDIGRALVLGSIPLAAVLGVLRIEHLYLVAFLAAVLTTFFDVAYVAYLPSLVRRDQLVEANSKLAGAASVAEVTGFGIAGWLVQWFTAPFAILADALSFLGSAAVLSRIRAPETPAPRAAQPEAVGEVREGLRVVARDPVVRAVAAGNATLQVAFGIFGTVYTLYTARDLGFAPGVLGMIYAVGGGASLVGAAATGPLVRRLGGGRVLIAAAVTAGVGMAFIPLAPGATLVGAAFLIAQQLVGDSARTVFLITQVSLRQALIPAEALGRANAAIRALAFGGTLLGTIAAGALGELAGARAALAVGAVIATASAGWLAFSPLRGLRADPAPA